MTKAWPGSYSLILNVDSIALSCSWLAPFFLLVWSFFFYAWLESTTSKHYRNFFLQSLILYLPNNSYKYKCGDRYTCIEVSHTYKIILRVWHTIVISIQLSLPTNCFRSCHAMNCSSQDLSPPYLPPPPLNFSTDLNEFS